MVHITENYYLDSDGTRNYMLMKRTLVGEGKASKKTLQENVGREAFYTIGYYSNLGSLFRSLREKKLIEELPSLHSMTIDEYFKKQDAVFDEINAAAGDLIRTLKDGSPSEENAPDFECE